MAGFEVIIYGRFWVITEEAAKRRHSGRSEAESLYGCRGGGYGA